MTFRPPLEEWDQVERTVVDPLGSTYHFSVTDDGIWREELIGLFPSPRPIETGHLNKWELRVLDAIIDQINREPIPDQAQYNGPATDDLGRYLDLTNDETTFRLSSEDRAGSYILADDPFDRWEIAALDAFVHYLGNKHGSYSGDFIIG